MRATEHRALRYSVPKSWLFAKLAYDLPKTVYANKRGPTQSGLAAEQAGMETLQKHDV